MLFWILIVILLLVWYQKCQNDRLYTQHQYAPLPVNDPRLHPHYVPGQVIPGYQPYPGPYQYQPQTQQYHQPPPMYSTNYSPAVVPQPLPYNPRSATVWVQGEGRAQEGAVSSEVVANGMVQGDLITLEAGGSYNEWPAPAGQEPALSVAPAAPTDAATGRPPSVASVSDIETGKPAPPVDRSN